MTTPWYREPLAWLVFVLPATAVVAGLSTLWIAVKHADDVVQDDWYKEGKSINLTLARDNTAHELGLSASVQIDALSGQLLVNLQQAKTGDSSKQPTQLTLAFLHPTQSRHDQHIVLHRTAPGHYTGNLPLTLADSSHYYVELADPDHRWRLRTRSNWPSRSIALP